MPPLGQRALTGAPLGEADALTAGDNEVVEDPDGERDSTFKR